MKKLEVESIDKLLLSYLLTTEPFPPHLHIHNNAYELMMFKAGNADYFINNITYRLTPGDLLFVCPNDIHGLSVKDHEPCERFPIHFNEAFIQTFSTPNTNILTCFQNHEHNHILHLSEDQMREYEYLVTQTIEALNRKEFGYDIYAKANLSLILLLANQASVTKPVRLADITPQAVKDAIQYVDQNLSNTLSIQDIADHLNLSRSRFCHLFKDFTGTSPWNYIIARRIQHACTLLQKGMSITDVYFECGFNDYAHFVKSFTKLVGISPGKYSKTLPGNTDTSESSHAYF